MTLPEELFEAARTRARAIEVPRVPEDAALERLRTECAAWFDRVPEPPMYRRPEDPARVTAQKLIPEGQELLARTMAVSRHESARALLAPLIVALEAHLATLCHTAEGRVEKAERDWHRALVAEKAIGRHNRLWVRSDEGERAVFDPHTRASRYDPGPAPTITVKLVCPHRSCASQERFQFSPRYATQRFSCPRCKRIFLGYFAEVRSVEVTRRPGASHYQFKVEEISGGLAEVAFQETSGAEFNVARRDLLAFLYDVDSDLKAVLNLSSSRLLWIHRGGNCFIVTAAFGPEARELKAFRAFRDEVLLPRKAGRAAVSIYYAVGPHLAKAVRQVPGAGPLTRAVLRQVHRMLVTKGAR